MQSYSVILDANVLYSATLRDTLMWLSRTDLFKARWTDDIHREWITALAKLRLQLRSIPPTYPADTDFGFWLKIRAIKPRD